MQTPSVLSLPSEAGFQSRSTGSPGLILSGISQAPCSAGSTQTAGPGFWLPHWAQLPLLP